MLDVFSDMYFSVFSQLMSIITHLISAILEPPLPMTHPIISFGTVISWVWWVLAPLPPPPASAAKAKNKNVVYWKVWPQSDPNPNLNKIKKINRCDPKWHHVLSVVIMSPLIDNHVLWLVTISFGHYVLWMVIISISMSISHQIKLFHK